MRTSNRKSIAVALLTLLMLVSLPTTAAFAGGELRSAGAGAARPAQVDTSFTVTPLSAEWAFGNDNGTTGDWKAGFEDGPATPPAGSGSLDIQLNSASAGIVFAAQKYQGTPFTAIQALSYSTYTNLSPAAMSFQINYDPDVTNVEALWYGRLVYEPYVNGTVTNGTWQTWDMIDSNNAKWWASSNANSPVDDTCGQASPCTLAALLASWPNIGIRNDGLSAIMFKAGSGTNNLDANADNLSIQIGGNTDTYDFEPLSSIYVDDSWSGVTPGTDPDGAGPATKYESDSFDTIQEGIDAVADGGTVHVNAGTYDGTMNIEGRSDVTILGEDAATTIVKPTSTTLAWNVGGYGTTRHTVLRVVGSTGTTVSNLTFDLDLVKANFLWAGMFWNSPGSLTGNTFQNNSLPDASGGYYEFGVFARAVAPEFSAGSRAPLTLSGNTFVDMGRVAILVHTFVNATIENNAISKTLDDFGYGIELGSQSTGVISGNTIHGFDTPAASDGSNSAGIYVENAFTNAEVSPISKNVTLGTNEVYDNQWGLYLGNEFDGFAGNVDVLASITGNNFHNNVDGAVYVTDEDREAGSSVTANFSSNTLANNGGYGYYLTTAGDGDLTVTIQGGSIAGHNVGVYMNDTSSGVTGSVYNVAVHNAQIAGNTLYGVQNEFAGATINAENNWWGDASGPGPVGPGTGDKVSTNVDFDPWCVNSLCANEPPVITEGASVTVTMSEDSSPIPFTLTLHATDPNPADALTWSISVPALHGTAVASGTGTSKSIGYTPNLDFHAVDSFTVQVSDGNGGTDTIIVTVNVNRTRYFYSSASQDGWILESGENTGVGGKMDATRTTFIVGDNASNRQYRSILSFNTFNLPDNAVITSARLRIHRALLVGTNPFITHRYLLADMRRGGFTGNPSLQLTDFGALASKSPAFVIGKKPSSGWYSRVFPASALPYISTTAPTQFRLRFQLDDDNDATADYMAFYSGNSAVYTPQLMIVYHLP